MVDYVFKQILTYLFTYLLFLVSVFIRLYLKIQTKIMYTRLVPSKTHTDQHSTVGDLNVEREQCPAVWPLPATPLLVRR